MKHRFPSLVIVIAVGGLQLAACAARSEPAQEAPPARVTHLSGKEVTKIVLTEEAAKRIDIHTVTIEAQDIEGVELEVVPYAAIIYDTQGNTWVYTNPGPLTYVRTAVQVDFVRDDKAVLLAGPQAGMAVVTVGVEELFGSETEFEEE